MSLPGQCPSADQWKKHLSASLSQELQTELTSHLDQCPSCQETLEKLALGSSSWEGMVANKGQKPLEQEPALKQVLGQLKGKKEGEETVAADTAGEKECPEFLEPSDRPDCIGRLGHYDILEKIGQGGFGTVFRAFDSRLHRIVAIKVLSPELAASGTARQRFIREARTAAAVTHEHLVTIHAVEEDHRPPYLVMQFVDGVSLQDKLNEEGQLGLKEILRIGLQIAEGVAAAHKQGLVHRDIKPGNILLENGVERVRITDFGLARAVDDATVTQSGVIAGTPMYMSPEQANGEAIDHRSDLFSLGTVLYVMCTGRPPFRASGTMAVLRRVCEETPRSIQEINPDIPDWLCDIIVRLHAKKPEERYQSAKEVAELLAKYLAELQRYGRVAPRALQLLDSAQASPAGTESARPKVVFTILFPYAYPASSPIIPVWLLHFLLLGYTIVALVYLSEWLRLDLLLPGFGYSWQRRLWLPLIFVLLYLLAVFFFFVLRLVFLHVAGSPDSGNEPTAGLPGVIAKEALQSQKSTEQDVKPQKQDDWKQGPMVNFLATVALLVALVALWFPVSWETASPPSGDSSGEEKSLIHFELGVLRPLRLTWESSDRGFWLYFSAIRAFPLFLSVTLSVSAGAMALRNYRLARRIRRQMSHPTDVSGPTTTTVRTGRSLGKVVVAVSIILMVSLVTVLIFMGPGLIRYLGNYGTLALDGYDLTLEQVTVREGDTVVATLTQPWASPIHLPSGKYELEFVCKPGFQLSNIFLDHTRYFNDLPPQFVTQFKSTTGHSGPGTSRFYSMSIERGEYIRLVPSLEKVPSVGPKEEWVQLFNRKDLSGWKYHPDQPGNWRVENGILISNGPQSHLFSERGDFKDFHLRAEVRINQGGDSGIFCRAPFGVGKKPKGMVTATGYEAQIMKHSQDKYKTGSLWGRAAVTEDLIQVDSWFMLEVIAQGDHLVVKVNGTQTAECKDDVFPKGHFALQTFHLGTVVQFKKIEIKELPPAQDNRTDQEKLQGKWNVVSGEYQGNPLSVGKLKEMEWIAFAGDTCTSLWMGKVQKGTFKLNPEATPRQLEILSPGGLSAIKAIYQFDGDSLTLCQGEPGKSYPPSFKTMPDSQCVVIHFHREKSTSTSELPFVILTKDARGEQKFATLAEAVAAAKSGDTIEIRHNGPFLMAPLDLGWKKLVIRAGPGFLPVIQLDPKLYAGQEGLINFQTLIILEGLELRIDSPALGNCALINSSEPSSMLILRHCKLVNKALAPAINVSSHQLEIYNSELITPRGAVLSWPFPSKGTALIDQSVLFGNKGLTLHVQTSPFENVSLRIHNSTILATTFGCKVLWWKSAHPLDPKIQSKLLVDATGSLIYGKRGLLDLVLAELKGKMLPLSPKDTQDFFASWRWNGENNLLGTAGPFLYIADKTAFPAGKPVRFPEDWKGFWKSNSLPGIAGEPRFQGGDLMALSIDDAASLTSADFRLAKDSPGKGAGANGKDMGADVEMIGPGKAYEQWQKSPEYQEWRKQTELLMK